MKLFGAGVLYATQTVDANGNAVTNPTPAALGILQGVTLNFEFETKPLYGATQFPVAVGRGKGKVTGKAKEALIYASLFNTAFWGQPAQQTTGLINIVTDTVGALIPTTPFQITPTVPSSGTWDTDLGVTDSTGKIYVRVASAPAAGQYSVAAGVYTFAAADTGKTAFINYRYTAAVTGSQKVTVQNLLMGYAPQLQIDMSVSYSGKIMYVRLPNALPSKFNFDFKNDDWTIPDFDWECFEDTSHNIAYYSMSE